MKLSPDTTRGPLSVGVEREQSVVTVTAVGEVDRRTTLVWREAWSGLWRAGVPAPVVLADLTQVTFFGSSGIVVLLDVLEKVRKSGLTLVVAASRPVRRSSQITGIDSRVALCDSLAEARARAARAGRRRDHVAHWEPASRPGDDASPAELLRCLRAENEQLRDALDRRAVVEQAKGMVMAHHQITADEAFELLRRLSQHTNVRIRDLAAQIVGTAVPGAGVSRAAGRRREN